MHDELRLRTDAPRRFGYRAGLDGVRAVAVVAVVLYHAGISWIPGGFLGVEVFFVLSGYLITSLLLVEWAGTRRLLLRGFWIRRGRRLLPAVWALLVGVFVLVLFHPGEIARFLRELPAALSYVYNWFQILSDQSYFAGMGRPSPLQHLWSLAVEEQFYLVWPVLVIVALRAGGRRALLVAATIGMVASVVLALVLFEPGADPSRIYYGTDTRAAGLLLGAVGAIIWHPSRRISPRHRTALVRVGTGALVLLVVAFWQVSEFGSFLYRGGLFLVSILSLLVAVAAADQDNPLARALSIPPLRWLGTRSYAIYLWHWPVMVFTRPMVDIPFDGWQAVALRVGLSCVLAELSYRFVETRFRQWTPRPRLARGERSSPWRVSPALAGSMATVVLAIFALAVAPTITTPSDESVAMAMGGGASAGVTDLAPEVVAAATATPASSPDGARGAGERNATNRPTPAPSPNAEPSTAASSPTATSRDEPEAAAGSPAPDEAVQPDPDELTVTAIGDSVMAGAIPQLEDTIPGRVVVDADIGRTSREILDLVRWHRDNGSLAPTVVVQTGNNGLLPNGYVDDVVEAIGSDRRVIFVNVRLPRRWEGEVNGTLAEDTQAHERASVLDWHGASNEHMDWFNPDGVHIIDKPGAQHYADLVAQATA